MSLPITIQSGDRNRFAAIVTPEQALKVAVTPSLSVNLTHAELTARKLLFEEFTNASGSSSMIVNGSLASPVVYSVTSAKFTFPGGVIGYKTQYIKRIRITIAALNIGFGQATNLRNFGPVTNGLTNGLTLVVTQGNVATPVFISPVKTLSNFLEYIDGYKSFLSVDNNPTQDLSVMDIVFDEPVVIPAGSLDRIDLSVRDNLTTQFYALKAQAIGWFEIVLGEIDL